MRRIHAFGLLLAAMLAPADGYGHEKLSPGFNLFSQSQDAEIGRESAAHVERELPILNNAAVNRYIGELTSRLAASAPGPDFSYRARVVNSSEINAFALPGGYLYVNRGLIEAANTEGQLAGVVAHEIAHVALRHGTHQASKAYLAQAGFSLLGGLIGKRESTRQIVGTLGGFGLNTLFLKYSRDAESQADALGARLMANAGYDSNEMADFFDRLRLEQKRNPSKLEQFFSDHPAPANRAEHIRGEAGAIASGSLRPSGARLAEVRSELRSMRAAPAKRQVASGQTARAQPTNRATDRTRNITVEPPSPQFRTFAPSGEFFVIDYPENWRVHGSGGYGLTIAPVGGIVEGDREPVVVYGALVNHYVPFNSARHDGNTILERATNDIVSALRQGNPDLRVVGNSWRRQAVAGANGLSVVLSGRSRATGREERIALFTRVLPDDHVMYALFIAPTNDFGALRGTYSRMFDSLRVNDLAMHR